MGTIIKSFTHHLVLNLTQIPSIEGKSESAFCVCLFVLFFWRTAGGILVP